MVLGIPKCYSPNGFHPISAKLNEDIDYHSVIESITFLADQLSLWYVLNFNMGINGKILIGVIS